MALVNLKENEIRAKSVCYDPGRGGKTSNLEFKHRNFANRINTEMVTVKTHGDCTLFFVFPPFNSDLSVVLMLNSTFVSNAVSEPMSLRP